MPKKSIIEKRWEAGAPHHPDAIRILQAMARLDYHDELDLRFGGDGDNGENLLYLMSEVLDREDRKRRTP
jgi:hypothetical protein